MADPEQTTEPSPKFDFDAYPPDSVFHERRDGSAKLLDGLPISELRPKPPRHERKERRRRIDPTTFEKQYTNDELEFMTAMQRFKVQSGKAFPTYGEVLRVVYALGYRRIDSHGDPNDSLSAVGDPGPDDEIGKVSVTNPLSCPLPFVRLAE
ncbi:hypothetical protein EP7_000645 [Isosphaeraceae bacterium EP7]